MSHSVPENERVKVAGGCHCGAVRFEADVVAHVTILDCNCSICSKTGFRHLIVPHGDFRLLRGQQALTSYRFGSGAADHLFCARCGVKSFYQPRSHPDSWSINFNALDSTCDLVPAFQPFDGRNWAQAREVLD